MHIHTAINKVVFIHKTLLVCFSLTLTLSSETFMCNEKLLVANYIVCTLVPMEVDMQIIKVGKDAKKLILRDMKCTVVVTGITSCWG